MLVVYAVKNNQCFARVIVGRDQQLRRAISLALRVALTNDVYLLNRERGDFSSARNEYVRQVQSDWANPGFSNR